jgi:exonuclease VII large subunit
MPHIDIDDDSFAELVTQAVKKLLTHEKSKLSELTDGFLDEAKRSQRSVLDDFESSKDKFDAKAQAQLADADTAISTFKTRLSEKRKQVEDALNVRVIAGFSAVLLILGLAAAAYLGERLVTVNEKAKEVTTAAENLKTLNMALQGAMGEASAAFKKMSPDPSSHIQTLESFTNRIHDDLDKLQKQLQPMLNDWVARHPSRK